MDDEQFNNEYRKNLQTVTSVGNSWVLCRSKSYSGRVYYFNTLTGEAAWNLSDIEVEKAKKRTNHLETQQGVTIEGCPEPKEPPMDHSNQSLFQNCQSPNNATPSRVYNKQIINNQFPKQTLPTFAPFAAQSCTHVVSPMAPLNVATPTFNPNIWAIPPNHQIFIAPTPYNIQPQGPVEITFGNQNHSLPVQNTSLPLSSRFQSLKDRPQKTSSTRYFQRNVSPWGNNHQFRYRKDFTQKKFHNNFEKNDLRQILCAKRNSKDVINMKNKSPEVQKKQEPCSQSTCPKPTNDDDDINTDGDWLDENIQIHEAKLNLDVTNLKKLANANANKDRWYIAADKDILLNHLIFLNILFHSDEKCHLMVPQEVVTELTAVVESRTSAPRDLNRARRAIDFLSQQLDVGSAIIGDESSCTNDFGDAYIMNSCLDLAEQNYHVVLLSNNNLVKEYVNATGVPVFNMKEIKRFLLSPFKEPEPRTSSTTNSVNAIKIIIPNDLLRTKQDNTTSNILSKDTECQMKEQSQKSCDMIKTNVQTDERCSKSSVDASVQTDVSPLQSDKKDVKAVTTDKSQLQLDLHKFADAPPSNDLTNSDKSEYTTSLKRREIRLKRSTSNQTCVVSENSVDKKQFKWRRRRNAPSTQTIESKQSSVNNSDIIDSIEDSVPSEVTHISAPNTIEQHNESINKQTENSREDNLDSSETGSYVLQRNISEKIVIEETSTSGIISNTSIDSDNESAKLRNFQTICNANEIKVSSQILMFEVTDNIMEEYLKMKCDEWVSRFVQIMEEVLTQVLQLDPPFQHSIMPPPWTLCEAAECIKIKFHKNYEVQCAANKLNNILLKISDARGKINEDITPREFMEMYSYGANIVDTLKSAVKNCEDLFIASESLSKLLSDIQNPHLDTSHSDNFGDVHDSSGNITQIPNATNKEHAPENNETEPPKEQEHSIVNDNEKIDSYNLRSKKKKLDQDNQQDEQSVKFIRNIDIKFDFFNSLHLQKTNKVGVNNCIENIKGNKKSMSQEDKDSSDQIDNDAELCGNDQSNTEPKIVRFFIKFPEFEKRLQNMSPREPLDLDHLDYYEDQIDYLDDECSGDAFYDSKEEEFKDATSEKAPDNDCSKTESPKRVNEEVNNNYHWIFGNQFQSITEALLEVNLFCEETRKEFSSGFDVSNSRKIEIRDKAEKAYSLIGNVCQCLKSIIQRETNDTENNTLAVLKKEGIDGFDDKQFLLYRAIIGRCEDQVNIQLECVNCILTAVNSIST